MADSTQVEIAYIEETTFGTAPGGAYQQVRHTGGSLGASTSTTRSSEVRSDAQRGQTVRTNFEPSATINMELSGKTFDDWIEAVLRGTWETIDDVNQNNDAIDNGGIAAADYDMRLQNGTEDRSFTLELNHQDVASGASYRVIKGAKVGQFSLDLSTNSLVTGSFNFTAKSYDVQDTAVSTSVDSAPDTSIFNVVDNIEKVLIDGVEISGAVSNFTISANANARRLNALGVLGSFDIGMGSMDLTGSITFYLDTDTFQRLKDYVDFKKMALGIEVLAEDGNRYAIHFPKIAVTNEPGNVPGPDEDVQLQFDYSAEPGGSSGKTIEVLRKQSA